MWYLYLYLWCTTLSRFTHTNRVEFQSICLLFLFIKRYEYSVVRLPRLPNTFHDCNRTSQRDKIIFMTRTFFSTRLLLLLLLIRRYTRISKFVGEIQCSAYEYIYIFYSHEFKKKKPNEFVVKNISVIVSSSSPSSSE